MSDYWMSPPVKLAVTIRFLTGGSMYDIADDFGFDISCCHRVKRSVILAILDTSSIGTPDLLPNIDNQGYLSRKTQLLTGLRLRNPLTLQGCIGALDGIAIPIIRPPNSCGPTRYRNRKCFYAIVCQGICDAQSRFIYWDCSTPGSTHDSVALSLSPLFPFLSNGLLNQHWIAVDAAYPLVGSLIKPYPGIRADPWENSFNNQLSNIRILSEDTFGIFVQRWRIFWGPLLMKPKTATKVICACVKLHNFIVDVDGVEKLRKILEDEQDHLFTPYFQDQCVDGVPLQYGSSPQYGESLRTHLCSEIERIGLTHPNQ